MSRHDHRQSWTSGDDGHGIVLALASCRPATSPSVCRGMRSAPPACPDATSSLSCLTTAWRNSSWLPGPAAAAQASDGALASPPPSPLLRCWPACTSTARSDTHLRVSLPQEPPRAPRQAEGPPQEPTQPTGDASLLSPLSLVGGARLGAMAVIGRQPKRIRRREYFAARSSVLVSKHDASFSRSPWSS